MNKFDIMVVDHNCDTNIYPKATKVEVTNDEIKVVSSDDDRFAHAMETVKEIIIKPLV